jgi:predicted PurR-regulated permease PerM
MLGLDRRTLRIAWTLFLFALLLLVIYEIGRTLIIFALALIFAHLLAPVVDFVQRFSPRRVPRVAVLGIVYVVLLGLLVSAMIPISSRISEEAGALANRLPETLQGDPLAHLPVPGWLEPLRPQLTSLLRDRLEELEAGIVPLLTTASTRILSGLTGLVAVVLIPILSFFFLKDGAVIRDAVVDSVNLQRRELVSDILADLHIIIGQYIRALVLLSIAAFLFYSAFLAMAGVPYPVLLAVLAALFEFIPVVGPLVASVTIVLVAGFAGYEHLLWIVLFLIAYRIFQDYVLSPYLMSAGVKIHPMLVLFGVLAGEQLLGVPGMFFSVPAMAALRVIFIRVRRQHAA